MRNLAVFGKCLLSVGFMLTLLAGICFYSDIYMDMVRPRGTTATEGNVATFERRDQEIVPAIDSAVEGERITAISHRF